VTVHHEQHISTTLIARMQRAGRTCRLPIRAGTRWGSMSSCTGS
jgi:hypothetical protein